VKVRIGKRKKNYAIGYIEEFIKKSDVRIKPKCKHFGLDGDLCGGCSMQFFSYEKQLEIKEQHVKDSISRIGGFDENLVRPCIGFDPQWYYRNKMEFSFSRYREGGLNLGLHIKRRHHDLVPLEECYLMNEEIGRFVSEMRIFFVEEDLKKKFDGLKSLIVREGKHTGEMMVNLICENFIDDELLENFKDHVLKGIFFGDKLKSIFFTNFINVKGKPKKIEETLLWGQNVINEELHIDGVKLKFNISPQAFFQPNTLQAEKLYALAISAAGLTGNEIVYDLYCGAGTITLALAARCKEIFGIELNASAIKNAEENARVNGATNAFFMEGDVLKKMPDITNSPDVVIVDPPRNGLQDGVVNKISELQPSRVVYVSCNPTTLARDLAIFKKTGYTLMYIQPVDMFPQTYHIENVALLERK
jgi:23S rRNA (uracil1939-C5)-methyltransferase